MTRVRDEPALKRQGIREGPHRAPRHQHRHPCGRDRGEHARDHQPCDKSCELLLLLPQADGRLHDAAVVRGRQHPVRPAAAVDRRRLVDPRSLDPVDGALIRQPGRQVRRAVDAAAVPQRDQGSLRHVMRRVHHRGRLQRPGRRFGLARRDDRVDHSPEHREQNEDEAGELECEPQGCAAQLPLAGAAHGLPSR